MTACLLDDLHSDLYRGERCPECGHDPYAETPPPVEDLRPWGWAPGGYMFICRDCPADISIMDKMDRAGDKRSYRCREHAIAARDAAAAAPVPEPIYVIWWTTQTDCEFIAALTDGEDPRLDEFPEWLRVQLHSRGGRNGRGRLWNAFPDALPGGIDPLPDTKLAKLVSGETTDSGRHSAAGIVVPLGDLNLVIGLPGFVTNAGMTRLLIHGVDLDL